MSCRSEPGLNMHVIRENIHIRKPSHDSTDEMYAKIYIILDPNFDVKNVSSPVVR